MRPLIRAAFCFLVLTYPAIGQESAAKLGGWHLLGGTDRMTGKQNASATLSAKAADKDVSAAIEMFCDNGRIDFRILMSKPIYQYEIGMSDRLDESAVQPRIRKIFTDKQHIYLLNPDLRPHRRYRVEMHTKEYGVLFYDFDLTGIREASKQVKCSR